MKLEIKVYGALCGLSLFRINGVEADENDFVDRFDHSPDTAVPYGCGNMQADIIKSTDKVLKKYAISKKEYYVIAERVSAELSFGTCGWCV
jgi:hypothetical protein